MVPHWTGIQCGVSHCMSYLENVLRGNPQDASDSALWDLSWKFSKVAESVPGSFLVDRFGKCHAPRMRLRDNADAGCGVLGTIDHRHYHASGIAVGV
jgi:hypothetical protein